MGQTGESFYVTLTEKRTLDSGFYLFVFTHTTTKDVVNIIYDFAEDESSYPRYNKFSVNTSDLFEEKQVGIWKYNVYEQESPSNTNVAGLTEVERGFLKLKPATEFAVESYSPATTYKQYGG